MSVPGHPKPLGVFGPDRFFLRYMLNIDKCWDPFGSPKTVKSDENKKDRNLYLKSGENEWPGEATCCYSVGLVTKYEVSVVSDFHNKLS